VALPLSGSSTDVTIEPTRAGYLKPGLHAHAFVGSSEGRSAAPSLTFGAFNENGPCPGAPTGGSLFYERTVRKLAAAIRCIRRCTDRPVVTRDPRYERAGPNNAPRVSPDGSRIAYLGFDDQL